MRKTVFLLALLLVLGTVLTAAPGGGEKPRNFKATMIGIVKSDGSIEIQGNILSRDLNISPAYMSARSRQSR